MQDEVKIRLEFDHLKSKRSTTNSLLQYRQISMQRNLHNKKLSGNLTMSAEPTQRKKLWCEKNSQEVNSSDEI